MVWMSHDWHTVRHRNIEEKILPWHLANKITTSTLSLFFPSAYWHTCSQLAVCTHVAHPLQSAVRLCTCKSFQHLSRTDSLPACLPDCWSLTRLGLHLSLFPWFQVLPVCSLVTVRAWHESMTGNKLINGRNLNVCYNFNLPSCSFRATTCTCMVQAGAEHCDDNWWVEDAWSWFLNKRYTVADHIGYCVSSTWMWRGLRSTSTWVWPWTNNWLGGAKTQQCTKRAAAVFPHFLRKLRSFNTCSKMLEIFYQSVSMSTIFFSVACWGGSISPRDPEIKLYWSQIRKWHCGSVKTKY